MKMYVGQLRNLDFVRSVRAPEWIMTILDVPKKTLADFRLAIDYRPDNEAIVPFSWLMPEVDAELSDKGQSRL